MNSDETRPFKIIVIESSEMILAILGSIPQIRRDIELTITSMKAEEAVGEEIGAVNVVVYVTNGATDPAKRDRQCTDIASVCPRAKLIVLAANGISGAVPDGWTLIFAHDRQALYDQIVRHIDATKEAT
jgi:hypothetical protein